MKPSSIAYVIVAYRNDVEILRELSENLLKVTRDSGFESAVYMVFNDDCEFDNVRGVHAYSGHGNVGFAKGVAIATADVSEDYVICVNPDCVVDSTQLGLFLRSISLERCILLPRLIKPSGELDHEPYEYWTFTLSRMISERLCKRFLSKTAVSSVPYKLPIYAKASGAFVGMPSAVARELDSPFDTDFFLYAEDRDMTRRARSSGIALLYVASSSITHEGGVSGQSISNFVDAAKTDGSVRFAYRRYGRVGAALYVLDEWLHDRTKMLLGRRVNREARRSAARRWCAARFNDPGPLSEQLLLQLTGASDSTKNRKNSAKQTGDLR